MTYNTLLLSAALAIAALPMHADIVDFESVPPSGNAIQTGTLTTQGFDFSSVSFHVIDDPTGCAGGCVDNGSQYLAVAGPGVDSPVMMTATGGQSFSVTSLDAAKLFLTVGGLTDDPNADTLDVLGTLSGGGTVSQSLLLPGEGSFNTFSLNGFKNLTSLTISGTGGGSTNASWAVDNMTVSATPEPSTIALAGCAFLFLGALVRRRLFHRC